VVPVSIAKQSISAIMLVSSALFVIFELDIFSILLKKYFAVWQSKKPKFYKAQLWVRDSRNHSSNIDSFDRKTFFHKSTLLENNRNASFLNLLYLTKGPFLSVYQHFTISINV
jgi:hypothetical protein